MIKKLFEKYKEVISYVFFGVLATVVNLVSFKIFNAVLGAHLYLLTNVISWLITVIFAYFTNKLWVFESKSWKAEVVIKELIGFFGARIFSLVFEYHKLTENIVKNNHNNLHNYFCNHIAVQIKAENIPAYFAHMHYVYHQP